MESRNEDELNNSELYNIVDELTAKARSRMTIRDSE
jgi:hypothetical protein